MNGPRLAAIVAALWLGSATTAAIAGNSAVDRARSLLAKGDAPGAIAVLEPALPTAGADLGPMIVVLRQAYGRAAEAAAKAGRPDEAEGYRENLLILNRQMRGRPQEPAPVETPKPVEPPPAPPVVPRVEPQTVPADPPPVEPIPLPVTPPPDRPEPSPPPATEVKPPTVEPATIPPETDTLAEADSAYLAGRYLDAGKGYSALAKAAKLPEGRKLHWAYCRSVDVVRRIKAKPATADEWASIDREIVAIKALSPSYWYAEYLRNRASGDGSREAVRAPRGRVVRGAMPESNTLVPASPSAIRDLTRPSPIAPAQPPARRLPKPGAIAMAIPSTDTPPTISTRGDSGNWKVEETENFLIHHDDPELAAKVGKIAEATRSTVARRWGGSPPKEPWSPKCAIYLYPTAAIFAEVTGQPAESPGFSTMESDGVRVNGRRVKLRADAPNLLTAVLPHEVTHVILADFFPVQQVPRWADEGIAVLSEPAVEQEKRLADLTPALDGGKIFSIEHLLVRDYPEGPYWSLYYAQSVSLTRYLVEQGTPAQFIDFLQGTQVSRSIPAELKRVYKIEGYADLQARWLAYARAESVARLATSKGETTTK